MNEQNNLLYSGDMLRSLRFIRRSVVLWVLVAIFNVGIVFFLGIELRHIIFPEVPVLLFLISVVVSALIGGAKSGLLATLASFLLSLYFFTQPSNSLVVGSFEDIVRLALFVLVGVGLSLLIEVLHVSRRRLLFHAQVLFEREQQLEQANKKITDILESITDAFFTLDENWTITYVNKQAEKILHHSKRQLVGKNMWQLFPDAVNTDFYTNFHKAKQTKKPVHFESWYPPHNMWAYVHVHPLKEGLSIYLSDETDRKRTEDILKQTEAKLMMLAQSPLIGITFSDIYGNITYANEELLRMIEYSRGEVEAGLANWMQLTPPEWHEADRKAIQIAQETGVSPTFEKEYISKSGKRIPIIIGFILYGENKDQSVAFVMDNTKRKELERQKDELVGMVSHELKTPVTSLKIYTQVLTQWSKKLGDDKVIQVTANMDSLINKLTRFINDLLEATRIQAGKVAFVYEVIGFEQLVKEVVSTLQATISSHAITIKGSTKAMVRVDKQRVEQVITNLITNAVKYSPRSKSIFVHLKTHNHHVELCVEDFGIGIPKDRQSSIFQRFYRVQDTAHQGISGIGLGLSIAADIVKRLKGKMWFHSAENKGSIFCFSLPTVQQ